MVRHRHEDSGVRRSQTTIQYGLGALDDEEIRQLGIGDLHSQFYPHMLIEDVSLWVMPILRHDQVARAVLEPPNRAAEDLVAQALGREYHGRDLAGAIFDFFRRCAGMLVAYAIAPYEIVYLYSSNSDAAVGFELCSIYPPTL